MDEVSLEEVKRRTIRGVLALSSRTFILQIISFLTTFLLTIFLEPSVFGIFFVVSALVSFLGYFSDVGLAAALIQKKEDPTEDDLRTTFSVQQVLVVTLVILALAFSSKFASFYRLDSSGLWLFRALVISFFLSSLKTIPSILLERRLAFDRLVIPQIVETLFYSLIVVIGAYRGLGIASFTLAVLARGFSGLITIYLLYPWKISFGFSKEKAKSLLSFGLPFQANSILALIKDDLFTVFLGKVLPFSEVGYIGWAKKWAEFPLRLVMDNVIKVTFPAYARLQGRPEYLSRAIEKSLFFISLLVFPISVGLVFLIKPLVFLIPRYSKWEPALFSFYIFVLVTVMATFSSPLTNAFNAIGKISISLKFMIMWTILLWCLSPFLITRLGFNGIPISFLIIGLTSFLVVFIAKKYFHFTVLNNINPSFISSLVMGTFLFLGQEKFTSNFISLFIYIFLGFTIYAATLLIFFKRKIFVEIRSLTK